MIEGQERAAFEAEAVDRVRRYYQFVDSGNIDSLVKLFGEDSVYHRPGYPILRGRREIEKFYREECVKGHGIHTLHDVIVERFHIAVKGEFSGALKDGTAVSLKFADFFVVAHDGRFSKRETFFFAG
jgi:ketosteroid isomerase-like protein